MSSKTSCKIKTLDNLEKIITDLKSEGKKIAHCHGVFDLFHPGHLNHFKAAKKQADILIVTLTKDEFVNRGPGRPIFNQNVRADTIASLEIVDYVAINEWPTAINTIKKLKPDFYVKGGEYANKADDVTGKIYDEEEAINSVGGQLYFTNEETFSSTSLINNFLTPYSEETKIFLDRLKQKYSADDVIAHLKGIEDMNVLVIGDIIIDEYHYCSGLGKTAEDNIVANQFIREEKFAGGVLAAANHLAGFCKNVTLLSCPGNTDEYDIFINSRLKENVTKVFYKRNDVPTVVKRRFVDNAFLIKMFEVCYLDNLAVMPKDVEDKILDYIDKNYKNFDLFLVTDFGHGCLTPKIIEKISKKAAKLALNVQTNSSNRGFNLITKFPKADIICIDEPELRLACHDNRSDVETLIEDIYKKMRASYVIITRGHRGSTVYTKKEGFAHIPVFSNEIVDRIGAGDAFFSIAAPCGVNDTPIELIGVIGNAVGALKVLIVGNRSSVERAPLCKYLITLLK